MDHARAPNLNRCDAPVRFGQCHAACCHDVILDDIALCFPHVLGTWVLQSNNAGGKKLIFLNNLGGNGLTMFHKSSSRHGKIKRVCEFLILLYSLRSLSIILRIAIIINESLTTTGVRYYDIAKQQKCRHRVIASIA